MRDATLISHPLYAKTMDSLGKSAHFMFAGSGHTTKPGTIPQANQELLSPGPGTKSSVGQLLPGGEAGVRAESPLTPLILEQVHDAALSSNTVWIS